MIEVPELDDLSLKNGNYLYVIQQLIDLLKSSEIKFIHAACLVVPSFSRLTNEQKCIFENIVSIFEKNINHIIPLITHNDGGCMKELSSLKKVGVSVSEQLYFRFNNSMLYNCEESEIIWNDREDSMNNLFKQLETVPSVNTSVGQTLKVLQTRKHFIESLVQAEFQKKEIKSKTKESSSNDDNKVCENNRPHKRSKGSKVISCYICGKNCNDNYSCSIRFNLYLACAVEFMFCVCCCPCFFPICKCGDIYCFRLKCIQQLIGCNCPCAIAHHYVEDRENASMRIKYELKSLKEAFMTTYCYITEDQDIINKSALQTDLSEELQARIDNLSIFLNNIQTNDEREIENKT